MLQHLVLFSLEGFASAEAKAEHLQRTKQALEALSTACPELQKITVMLNENPKESYDLALIAEVESLEALALYAAHPEHVRIVEEYLKPYLKSRACIDYSK